MQFQTARVVAIENSEEPSEERPEPAVPADTAPLLAVPVPTVLEETPPASPARWQPGSHAGHKSWNCPAAGSSPEQPAPLIRD